MAAVALLDALRVLTDFDPPPELPPCDLDELADVLDAHGLAPLASYQLESRRLGAGVPMPVRERLLAVYQGVVNDNVFRMVTLRGLLKGVEVPAVILGGAAYVDWLYPHLAFRPLGDLRLAVRGADGNRFAESAARAGFRPTSQGPGGHTAVFGDGRIEVRLQEGLEADVGDDVPVRRQAGVLPGGEIPKGQAQRPAAAQRLVLDRVPQPHAPLLSVAEVVLDDLMAIAA